MNLYYWFNSSDFLVGGPNSWPWPWVTIVLSALVAAGYCIMAVNWYFQSKLDALAESKATLARLRGLTLTCAACGYIFFATDTPWLVWRFYDGVLFVLILRTTWFIAKMRGWGLVGERLAQINALEEVAARYREIAELLPQMVWTATADGRVDFSNQRWREYAASNRTWLQSVHPDDRHVLQRWEHAVAVREPTSFEVRLAGVAGYRTFLLKARPVVDGHAVKWLGACADIEDQKLLAAEKELQAKQKSFFLNALSHDLRAPLHNVVLNAHLLKMSAGRDEADVQSLNMIVENAVAAGSLVSKLLDFAKAGAQDKNVIEPVAILALLRQVERRFLPLAEQKGLYLQIRANADDVTLATDRQKLERIISNLVDNAIKYTSQGGVTLELSAVAGQTRIRILDTGMGIPKASAPYLFDEFYQVSNYERDRSKGFGMGLAICKSLARNIGADVQLASTGPEGSCFDIVFDGSNSYHAGRPGSEAGDYTSPNASGLCRI